MIVKIRNQISIVLHVDDFIVTSESQDDFYAFELNIKRACLKSRIASGIIHDHVDMTFDFTTAADIDDLANLRRFLEYVRDRHTRNIV